ncbi:MAG: hypothetical protein AAGA90_07495 [Actinomycetota bacterium]
MTDMLTQLLAEERVRRMQTRHLEAEKRRAWMAKPTRPVFRRRFQRR